MKILDEHIDCTIVHWLAQHINIDNCVVVVVVVVSISTQTDANVIYWGLNERFPSSHHGFLLNNIQISDNYELTLTVHWNEAC